jgi:hypothetical protein
MSGILTPSPFFQAFSPQGAFLVGGQLFTYVAGTVTPQATYTDSTLGTPNANPVILDAYGSASVWLDPAKTYKFVLKDAFGNQVGRTVDQIQGSVTAATLSVTLTQSYLGAILTPPTSAEAGIPIINPWIAPGNVLRYGADPLGVASSLTAFNNARAVAMAGTPHGFIYIPAGKYLIPNPGLSWSDATDIRIYGDGPEQSLLTGDTTSYTILTISQDHGGGSTGTYLNLSNFGIKNNPAAAGQHALSLADYLYCTLQNMVLFSSGNTLTFAGMANFTCTNLNLLTWNSNAAGNSSLVLKADTAGVPCGPGVFHACQVEGSGAVTTGGAVNSTGSFGLTFNGTQFVGLGPALVSVAEFSNKDDVTLIDCYSESCTNTTTTNTASLFFLGRTLAPINFTVLGGTFNSGDGAGHFCKYGITGNNQGPMVVVNAIWNNFATAAMNFATGAPASVTILNTTAAGGAATVVAATTTNAPAGGTVQLWTGPSQTAGWGVPAGPAVVANFPATPTLAQCGAAIGQIIADLTKRGTYAQ